MVFKGCIPFTVITKFWLYPPCCTIHLIPNSSYLGSIREEFVNFYLCILKSCFLKMDSLLCVSHSFRTGKKYYKAKYIYDKIML